MITEILDLAKGYAPKLNTVPIVLMPFLETALNYHRTRLARMEISLTTQYEQSDDIQVVFDCDQIHRVFELKFPTFPPSQVG